MNESTKSGKLTANKQNISNREAAIDYARVFAMLCVILCHSVGSVYSYDTKFISTLSDPDNLFRIASLTFGHSFGVPFFVMITGFLLLDRTFSEEKLKDFYLNKCTKLIICTMIWILINDLFYKLFLKEELSIGIIIKDALFLHKTRAEHLWYMPMIIGFYLCIPLITIVLKQEKLFKYVAFLYGCYYVYFSLIPFLEYSGLISGLDVQFSEGFSGGIYGLFLITGFLVKKRFNKVVPTYMLVVLASASYILNVAFAFFNYRNTYIFWYNSPFILSAGIALFELITRLKRIKSNAIIVFLA